MKKLLPWPGGKARLGRLIAALLPPHRCYVEPFVGGGGVYAAKAPSEVEVLNDLNQDLVRLFRVWQRHPEAFLEELGLVVASRRMYEDCWTQPGLTDVERAARFWYRVRLTFCNKPAGRSFGYGTISGGMKLNCDPERIRADILAFHARLCGTTIESLPWEQILRRYDRPHTCFYLDPPYYGMSKIFGPGLDFAAADHERLALALRPLRGAFLLSLNDRAEVRALYAWARRRRVSVRYSVGTNTPAAAASRRSSGELLITNRPWRDGRG